MGTHKSNSKAEHLKNVRDNLKEIIIGALEMAKVANIPPFVIAGAPEYSPSDRMIPCINDS